MAMVFFGLSVLVINLVDRLWPSKRFLVPVGDSHLARPHECIRMDGSIYLGDKKPRPSH